MVRASMEHCEPNNLSVALTAHFSPARKEPTIIMCHLRKEFVFLILERTQKPGTIIFPIKKRAASEPHGTYIAYRLAEPDNLQAANEQNNFTAAMLIAVVQSSSISVEDIVKRNAIVENNLQLSS